MDEYFLSIEQHNPYQQQSYISCGADPEIFFYKGKEAHSAEGLVGGTKKNPRPIPGLSEGFFVQEDNVAAEFNIPPATNEKQFAQDIKKAVQYIRSVAWQHNLRVKPRAAALFPWAQLTTAQARELGCDPDYDAWTGTRNNSPDAAGNLRTAAGHVHLSSKFIPIGDRKWLSVIQSLDLFLGVPSVLITEKSRRREMYGRAGAFRPKPYGVEWRVLDNFWIFSSPQAKHIFSTAEFCVRSVVENPIFIEEVQASREDIIRTINEHDKVLAQELIDRHQLSEYPK